MPHRRVHGECHRQVVVSDDPKPFDPLAGGKKLAEYAVPLTFEGAGDTSNARTWSVQVDGVANRAKLKWQNGGLFVPSAGTIVTFR